MNTLQVVYDHMYPYKTLTPVPKGQIQFSKVLFYLSDDWSERSIIAQFKQGEKVLNRSLNSDNSCYIPSDFDIGLVTVYLKGYGLDGSSVATANGVSIPIVQGAFDGGEPAVPPEPDLYAKLIEEFSKGIDQERISIAVEEYLNENPIQEKDPTVPDWAKQPQKPTYTAQEVDALPATTHIPTALSELSEDATHRVVTDAEKATWNAKSNFTGSYNDLTDKPTIPDVPVQSVNGKTGAVVLSADDVGALPASTAIPEPYTLPIATETTLGGVKPVSKTDEMTQSVGVDAAGGLWAKAGSGGSAGTDNWELINTIAVEGDSTVSVTFSEDSNGEPFALKKFYLIANTSAKPTYMAVRINGLHHNMQFASGVLTAGNLNKNNPLRILWEIISSGFYMMLNSNSGSLLLRMDGENAGYGNVQSHIAAVNTVSFVWGTGDAYANGDTFTLYGVRA